MRDWARDQWLITEATKRTVRPWRDALISRFPALARPLTRRPGMQSLRKQRFYWTDPGREPAALPYTEAFVQEVLHEVHEHAGADENQKVLEVGSGLGMTLTALVEHGFTDVTGVEINPLAVDRMRADHPELEAVPMLIGPAEDVLADLPDDSFAVIVAVRTLQHTHPDSAHLFATLARLAPTIITVDEAAHLGRHSFPWDLAQEFGRHGMTVHEHRQFTVQGKPTSSEVLTMRRRGHRGQATGSHQNWRRWLAAG
ncbi:class I SAM-dependent methyltransferase [Dermacoccaceae bacterium W4C1]